MEKTLSLILSKMGKIGSLIEISRPWNGLVMFLAVIIGAYFISTNIHILNVIFGAFSFLIVYMAGTTLNDIFDRDVDKINMPYRPLESGRLSLKSVKIFTLILYLSSFFISYNIGLNFFLLIILFAVLSLLYSVPPFHFSRRGILGLITLSIVSILIPIYAGSVLSLGSFFISNNLIIIFISLTALFSFIIITKDFKDIKGDKKIGKKTIVTQLGKKNTVILSTLGIMIFYPLSTFLIGNFINNFVFYLISSLIFILILFSELNFSKNKNSDKDEKEFGKIRLNIISFIILILIFLIIK